MTRQQLADTLTQFREAGPAVVGAAAVGAIADHFLGLVGILFFLVVGLWTVDVIGGSFRAVMRGYFEGVVCGAVRYVGWPGVVNSLSARKAAKGIGKLIALALFTVVGGAVEIMQMDSTWMRDHMGGTYIPVVAPGYVIAITVLGSSILDQVLFFWDDFGRGATSLLKRWGPGGPKRREDDVPEPERR